MLKFEGIVERLFVNDRKTAKGNKKSISIANNKVYYGLGLHDKETYEVDGVVLKEGMTVSFEYEDGKYKNVVLDTLKIVQQEIPKEVKKQQVDKTLPIRLLIILLLPLDSLVSLTTMMPLLRHRSMTFVSIKRVNTLLSLNNIVV